MSARRSPSTEPSAVSPPETRVVAVISVYNAPADLTDRVRMLLQQLSAVVVVDDGSHTAAGVPGLAEIARVISCEENRGIAAALNTGVRAATELGATFVLTMDQDSKLCDGYVEGALATWRDASDRGLCPGLVSARTHNGAALPVWGRRGGYAQLFDPMQSGTLIAVETLQKIGPFDETLFIDCVDTDYNIRLSLAGYMLVAADSCDLQHELGEARPLRVFGWQPRLRGRPMEVLYHAPFRTYYITRNNTVLRMRYGRKLGTWMLRRQVMEVESAAVCLVYGPERRKHLFAMWFGWVDAHRGRSGRIPEPLQRKLR